MSLGLINRLKAKLPPRLLKVYQTISLGGKRVTAGYGLSLLMLATLSVVSYLNAVRLNASAERIRHLQTALTTLNQVTTLLAEADYSRRGYYLYRDQTELEGYQSAVAGLEPALNELDQALAAFPAQAQHLVQLKQLTGVHLHLTQQSVEQFQQTTVLPSAQNSLIAQVRQNQRQIQQLVQPLRTELETELQTLSDLSDTGLRKGLKTRIRIEAIGTLFTFLISLLVYLLLCRQKVGRLRAETRGRVLAKANELSDIKLQFFSMVSHEFRTPLSVILGSAQLLESMSPQAGPAQLKSLHRIQSSAQRMTRLLSDVLTIARADAGKLEFQPSSVELQSFCLNLIEDFQTFAEQQQIQFRQQINRPEFATYAQLDERLIYSILGNLLSNALKYSPPGCPVEFRLICDQAITFQIRDQGIGISEADQKQLYEPFSRGQNVATITGTGLGLALVKRCVELHRGEVVLESLEGVGTTVTVTIPQPL